MQQNYLAVVKLKGAAYASKASFSSEGTTAALKKMCELLQSSIRDVEEYDLFEILELNKMRVVASRTKSKDNTPSLPALPPPTADNTLTSNEKVYNVYIKETI